MIAETRGLIGAGPGLAALVPKCPLILCCSFRVIWLPMLTLRLIILSLGLSAFVYCKACPPSSTFLSLPFSVLGKPMIAGEAGEHPRLLPIAALDEPMARHIQNSFCTPKYQKTSGQYALQKLAW